MSSKLGRMITKVAGSSAGLLMVTKLVALGLLVVGYIAGW